MTIVRVALPAHLRTLAEVDAEVDVRLEVSSRPTIDDLLDALEAMYPTLRGTIRNHESGTRRAYLRFFACGEDWSHVPMDTPLPAPVTQGAEHFRILGAIAGG